MMDAETLDRCERYYEEDPELCYQYITALVKFEAVEIQEARQYWKHAKKTANAVKRIGRKHDTRQQLNLT